MEHKAGEQGVTEVYVYVGEAGKANLERGMDKEVWGWKSGTAEEKAHHEVLASLKEGDLLHLGHLGLGRIPGLEAQTRSVSQFITTRLTGGLYTDDSPVWDDEIYPYRVPIVVEKIQHDVTKDDIGAEGIEALRKSASGKGGPRLLESEQSVVEQLLQGALEEYKGGLLGTEDPDDRIDLDLPSVLDRQEYGRVRVEQKKLRAAKLGKRTEVPCDLCQLTLPKRLVHTAHIKRRSVSSSEERRDLENVMFACVLGCDSLFEHGYVYVDADGLIHASNQVGDGALATAVTRLGESCTAFSEKSAPYFAWHRQTIADVKEG
ncbi:hypothetical protein ACFW4K_00810 [Nocardiopsis alba]|uniref:hypothetical protein n=1 Tax=Nocardiopsis alba TaxID=53437 RepID=UPI003672F19B